MGGYLSHEYHYISEIGEDHILNCSNCGCWSNTELGKGKCPKCNKTGNVNIQNGIEVGHTFLLGDKYSKPLKAVYLSKKQKFVTLQMGSYGLGLSRIMAAAIEVLSNDYEMRWPIALAPFTVLIVPSKVNFILLHFFLFYKQLSFL